MLTANRANARECTGPAGAEGKARVTLNAPQARRLHRRLDGKAPPGGRSGGRGPVFQFPWKTGTAGSAGKYRHLWDGQAVARNGGPGAGRYPAGRIQNGGRGVVLGARLGALTSKAGMSFSFMGIMLATARSIKDSGCGLEAAGRLGVLVVHSSAYAGLALDARPEHLSG